MAQNVNLSVVVPLYNTEPYLHDLLASFERQQGGNYGVEFVFVDDSSPDNSARVAQEWLTRTAKTGQVLHQPNRGVSAARNNGLDHASGDWITFIDSDDYVSDEYFHSVSEYLQELDDKSREVALVSCNVVRFDERTGQRNYRHPLRAKFSRGNWTYDLDSYPELIQSQAASAFFNVDRLRSSGIRFLEGLHAAEDAIFVASYLLTQDTAAIACVPAAIYLYRTRAAGDSAVDQYKSNPGYYFDRFTEGYLPLFQRAAALGRIPAWLSAYFVYDMRWFFPRELVLNEKATHLTSDEKARVLANIREVLAFVSPDVVRDFSVTELDLEQRNLLLALMGAPLTTDGFVQIAGRGTHKQVELRYYFTGPVPQEDIRLRGEKVAPVSEKIRHPDYLAQSVLRERVLWVEADDGLSVDVNGVRQRLVLEFPRPQRVLTLHTVGFDDFVAPNELPPPNRVGRTLVRRAAGRVRREAAALVPRAFAHSPALPPALELRHRRVVRASQVYAQTPTVRQRYADAWIFIDQPGQAGGSAEAAYWHTARTRPDINAWVAVRKSSADWKRLKIAGAKVLAVDALEYRAAALHAQAMISSRPDAEIPLRDEDYWQGIPPWQFVYLPMGTLQHDDAMCLNARSIALIVVRSTAERDMVIADGSPFVATALQVCVGDPLTDAQPTLDAMVHTVRGKDAPE